MTKALAAAPSERTPDRVGYRAGSGFFRAEKNARAACSGVASSLVARVGGRPLGWCCEAGFRFVVRLPAC